MGTSNKSIWKNYSKKSCWWQMRWRKVWR